VFRLTLFSFAIGRDAQNAVKKYIIHLAIRKMTVVFMINNHTEAFSLILTTCLEEKIS